MAKFLVSIKQHRSFETLDQGFTATRYHSLVIEKSIFAFMPGDDWVWCLLTTVILKRLWHQHKEFPIQGVQFHPESILTEHKAQIIGEFYKRIAMEIRSALDKIIQGQDLSEHEMFTCLTQIMSGEATDTQIGALLVAMRMKGETIDEISGAVNAM